MIASPLTHVSLVSPHVPRGEADSIAIGSFVSGMALSNQTMTDSVSLRVRDEEEWAPPEGALFYDVRDWQVCFSFKSLEERTGLINEKSGIKRMRVTLIESASRRRGIWL